MKLLAARLPSAVCTAAILALALLPDPRSASLLGLGQGMAIPELAGQCDLAVVVGGSLLASTVLHGLLLVTVLFLLAGIEVAGPPAIYQPASRRRGLLIDSLATSR